MAWGRWLGRLAIVAALWPGLVVTGYGLSLGNSFSFDSNPSGDLSYGYTTSLGGEMTLHASHEALSGVGFWRTDLSAGAPGMGYNPTGAPVAFNGGGIIVPALSWLLHPGPSGQIEVVRYTAPSAGSFLVSGWFAGADTSGTTTDVHVLLNGSSLFNGIVSGYGDGSRVLFNTSVTLNAGDFLDFAVGANGGFISDSTAMTASLTAVPEPAGLGCVAALGMVGVAAWHRRRAVAKP